MTGEVVMYALARHLGASQLLRQQTPLLTVSLVLAELFYKFGSFTLECLAFLTTWAVLDVAAQGVRALVRPGPLGVGGSS